MYIVGRDNLKEVIRLIAHFKEQIEFYIYFVIVFINKRGFKFIEFEIRGLNGEEQIIRFERSVFENNLLNGDIEIVPFFSRRLEFSKSYENEKKMN